MTKADTQSWAPDTYLIICGVALLVYLLSLWVPAGQFDLLEVQRDGRTVEMVDPASFRYVEGDHGARLFATEGQRGLFNALFEGMTSGSRNGGAVGIAAFILITGGAFGIVQATGTIDRAIAGTVAGSGGNGFVLLCSIFLLFSLGGAVFGMGEEVIPLLLVVLPVLTRLGFNNITAVLATYVATQLGFASSWMNPFSVAIAQGIAGLPLLSGMSLRIVMWVAFTLAGLLFTLRYAYRHRQASVAGETGMPAASPSGGDWVVLFCLGATLVWIVWGVVYAGYYLPEIATQFVVLGCAAGLAGCLFRLNGMTANSAAESFRQGAMGLLPAAMVIGLARGVVYLMGGDDPQQPSMLNTLLHVGSSALDGLPDWLSAWTMLLGQSVFNFFITSGSGQAALTMPLMAPLSDLLDVSRQVAVLAFQLGDGLTNILVPTSAALMGCLGAARVDWLPWIRAIWRFYLLLFALASAFVIGATLSGYQ